MSPSKFRSKKNKKKKIPTLHYRRGLSKSGLAEPGGFARSQSNQINNICFRGKFSNGFRILSSEFGNCLQINQLLLQ